MKLFLNYKKKMSPKLIKITCNLTGKTMSIYEDYYDKKVLQYEGEENLKKFYIQNKIISLIKGGHSIEDIANSIGFAINKDDSEYYNELINFHRGKSLTAIIKDTQSNFMETDSDVSEFITKWINHG